MKGIIKHQPKKLVIILLLFVILTGTSLYLLYALSLLKGIENGIRLLLSIIVFLLWTGFSIGFLNSLKRKKSKYVIYLPIVIIYSIFLSLFGFYIIKTYKIVDHMTTNKNVYSSSLVVLSKNKATKLEQLNQKGDIGILSDSTSVEGNQIPTNVIQNKKLNNKQKEYDDYPSLIQALYDGEVEGIFLPSNYISLFQNSEGHDFNKIAEETKVIYTEEREEKQQTENKNASLKDPFTILLMGIDSEKDKIEGSVANGDSLMVITFNPTTLNATILSIPRDTYVPIMCVPNHLYSKITHSAGRGGQQCVIDTIENLLDIKIDYYVKMNFKGVVKLVDTLKGIDIDVPFAFCEQNSDRKWGSNTVYVEKGFQTLNGEQALAYSRHREDVWAAKVCPKKYLYQGTVNDFVRGQHQQEVVRAILNKMKTVRSLDTIYKLLDTVSNNMQTNMSTSQILSLYNIGKDIIAKSSGENVEDLLGIQKLYLSGYDAKLYDALGGTAAPLYEYVYYQDSLDEIVEAMKINLGLVEPTMEKEFTFAIDEPYKEYIPGKSGSYKKSSTSGSIPNFVGDTEVQARNYAKQHGITIAIRYVQEGSGSNGTVISQSVKSGVQIRSAGTVTLTILKKEESIPKEETTKKEETDKKEENNKKDPSDTGKEEGSGKEENPSTDVDKKDEENLENITGIE